MFYTGIVIDLLLKTNLVGTVVGKARNLGNTCAHQMEGIHAPVKIR